MASAPYPFKLRKHSDGIMELAVEEPVNKEHQGFVTVMQMLKKLPYVIFSLEEGAKLDKSTKDILTNLKGFGQLIIVTRDKTRIPFPLPNVCILPEVSSALSRIGTSNVARGIYKSLAMPPFKPTALNLLGMLADPEMTYKQVEKESEEDLDLIRRIVSIAGHTELGTKFGITDLNRLVKYFGFEGLRILLIGELADRMERIFPNMREKMVHLRRTAVLTKGIAKLLYGDYTMIGKLISAGLMHDIGSMALHFYNQASYGLLAARIKTQPTPVCELELEIFGMDHCEMGSNVAAMLNLPEYITKPIQLHHTPKSDQHDVYTVAVMLANSYLNEQVEHIASTPCDDLMPILSEERKKNTPKGKEDDIVLAAPDEDAYEFDTFNPNRIVSQLQEIYDNYLHESMPKKD